MSKSNGTGTHLVQPRLSQPNPPIPPKRLFKVVNSVNPAGELVEAHDLQFTEHGDLLFRTYTYVAGDLCMYIRRVFAAGHWYDVEEVNMTVGSAMVN